MGPAKKLKDSRANLRLGVLLLCLLLLAGGVVIAFLHLEEGLKYFLSGALLGVGAGGTLTELTSVRDRRESKRQMAVLRDPILANCRLAYSLGDYVFNFYAHLSKGDTENSEVVEFTRMSEVLGIGDTVRGLVAKSKQGEKVSLAVSSQIVEAALDFKGSHLKHLFRLGVNIHAIRGSDAKKDEVARSTVAQNIRGGLGAIKSVLDDPTPLPAADAWSNIMSLWDGKALSDQEVDDLLLVFHSFLTDLGLSSVQAQFAVARVLDTAQLRLKHQGRPKGLDSLLTEIAAARAEAAATSGG